MEGGLRSTQRATVEEQVAKFLWVIGQDTRHSACLLLFHRSGETVSRHFHQVLEAIIELEDKYLLQLNGLQDCVGVIDGMHIHVKVPVVHGRKEYPTMNISSACTFDLKFTYVLTGWEGIASDSRIMKNALTRYYPLHIPIVHNFLMGLDPEEGLIAEVDAEIAREPIEHTNHKHNLENHEDARKGELIRNSIANAMWEAYHLNQH
ncbi:hypothetical protein Pint_03091 [Pistacia integerrima]|uniref:Uncharacterized protein n=1 Tax=Pistacia integerrima TaxID=434235 RepID=A0ACC0ZJU5_9ROSI|nr:hypothetical protein Pint_03091 [Pistacia integerrima]